MIIASQLPLAANDFDLFKTILIIAFVVGGLIVQAIKKARGETDEDEQPTPPDRRTPPTRPVTPPKTRPYNADSEEVRKFLEALGKPRTAAPPPPILRPVAQQSPPRPPPAQRRPIAPPQPVRVSSEGASDEEEGPRNIITGESTRQPIKPMDRIDLSKEMAAVEAAAGAAVAQPPRTSAPVSAPSLATTRAAQFAKLLAEKSNVRQAVVLAEVIGPPKAFL